jgi:peptidyl-prolyl cis-trans isomerase SurA
MEVGSLKLVLRFAPASALLVLLAVGPLQAQAPGGGQIQTGDPKAQRLDGIAAVVNDEVVLQSDVEEQLYLFLMRNQARPDSSIVDTLRRQILDQLIDEKLIVAEARKQNVSVPDAEVNKQVDEAIREAKERMGGQEAFDRQLAQENLTEEKLREKYRTDVRRQMLAQRLVAKQIARKTVTPAEAEAYFKAHRDKFPKAPAELRLQVIQIPVRADSVADRKARERVLAARKRIQNGERFAKVAAEVSDDASSRSGGDLGFFTRGSLEPEFERAAFAQKVGELSQPVRSSVGWHIIETLERDTLKTRAGRDSLDREGQPIAEVHARHILVRVELTDADVERAKKQAEKVRAEVVKPGADFGALVKRYSKFDGPQTPDGDIGFLSVNTLTPNIRAGLEDVPVGGISEVLLNRAGFNIFKVVEKKPEREFTLEEIKDELPDAVAQIQFREKYDTWVKGLRSKAHIEIRNS